METNFPIVPNGVGLIFARIGEGANNENATAED